MKKQLDIKELTAKSNKLRIDILKMIYEAGSGHPGGSLSSIDILNILYNKIIVHKPEEPNWPQRDRFILSKGHVCPALYAVLADCGYFDPIELNKLRKFGCILQGHPCIEKTPGIEVSSGSLGQGLSVATGIALASKMNKEKTRVFCLMGDGELQEGQIWEAAMSAGHYKLDNLVGIVDYNKLQIDGKIEEVMNISPLVEKWIAFNWNVIEVDGHNLEELSSAFTKALNTKDRPSVLIAHTIKGKGVSFMENNYLWHGTAPNQDQYKKALTELQN